MRSRVLIFVTALLAGCTLFATLSAADVYYSLDSAIAIAPSSKYLSVQFDTTSPAPQFSQFFALHPCLDDTVAVENMERGFYRFGISPGTEFDSAWADLTTDNSVNRCYPVYTILADSVELEVTDMISVQFEDGQTVNDALDILDSLNLHFVDSSHYRHLSWQVALDDTIWVGPLDRANELHLLSEVEWATPTMYIKPILQALPVDSFFQWQYYLHNTGQLSGQVDCDIDADSAWLFALSDSDLIVAVIDDGGVAHEDLNGTGLSLGRDFYDNDTVVTPGASMNHGMACAGILGATHNGIGIAGVNAGCTVVPIKVFGPNGEGITPQKMADAIVYANWMGARVASCSWIYPTTAPITTVQSAIYYATVRCGSSTQGTVMVFSAGNANPIFSVPFPANMPEVISVGAIDRTGGVWDYSCRGAALDLVAPSGDADLLGDVYTLDQAGTDGWNPNVTRPLRDVGLNISYTKAMGGTSASCPQVAGIVSLLLARQNPHISYCWPTPDVLEILTNTCDDVAAADWDDSTGHGRANAYRALVAVSRGDMNGDANLDILDVIGIVNEAFRGAPASSIHPRLADILCDGEIDILDVIAVVNVAFRGYEPPEPCFIF